MALLGVCSGSVISHAEEDFGAEWSIAIYRGPSPFALAPPPGQPIPTITARDVTDRTSAFAADPFLVQDGATWYVFFEIYDRGQGDIAVASSPDLVHWDYRQVVVDEPFHLSFPYVFQANGTWYMIPESHASNSVRLYRATSFPFQWTLEKKLLDGVDLVDNMITFRNGLWWLFSSPPTNDSLRLFYSPTLTGTYTEHPLSPVVSNNADDSRGAGRLLDVDGRLYRFAQDDNPTYGNRTNAFEITDLTTTTYAEVPYAGNPVLRAGGTGWNAVGMHTLNPVRLDDGTWVGSVDGLGDSSMMSKAGWSIAYVDSEETTVENDPATKVLDGIATTFWHTQFGSASPPPPHEIQVDLGAPAAVFGFRYTPRQFGSRGNIGQYEFYVSPDGHDWSKMPAAGMFANDQLRKEVRFGQTPARFVRLRALTSASGDPYSSMAEFDLLGARTFGNEPPWQWIESPAHDVTIYAEDAVTFAGRGFDADGDLPLTYLWRFDDGSGVPNTALEDPGPQVFNVPGTYTVSLRARDARGLACPTLDTRVVTVLSRVIPKSLWKVTYADSQETAGENGAAANAIDGNKLTLWHTQWQGASPPPPHEIRVDLGATYGVEGFRYLPRQDGGTNGRIGKFEFYVSADGVTWGTPAATDGFSNDASEKEVRFPARSGRFVRLVALTSANGDPYTSVAELSVIGVPGPRGVPPPTPAPRLGLTTNVTTPKPPLGIR